MPRIRSLKPEHRTHRRVGKFTDFEYRLWASMILEADDEGRLVCDADQLRAQTWPYHPKVTIAKVEAAVQAIAEARRIVLYDVADVHYAAFPKWKHHQHPKYPTPTKLPAPPGAFPKSSPNAPPTLGEDSPRSREGLSREELRGVELRGGESRGEDAPPSAAGPNPFVEWDGLDEEEDQRESAEWFNACGEGRRRQCVKTEYLGHADLPVQCYTHEALSGRRRRLALECARTHRIGTPNHPTPPHETRENPPESLRSSEGS